MNLSASSAKPTDPTYFLEGIIHDKSEMADFEGPLSLILLLLSNLSDRDDKDPAQPRARRKLRL